MLGVIICYGTAMGASAPFLRPNSGILYSYLRNRDENRKSLTNYSSISQWLHDNNNTVHSAAAAHAINEIQRKMRDEQTCESTLYQYQNFTHTTQNDVQATRDQMLPPVSSNRTQDTTHSLAPCNAITQDKSSTHHSLQSLPISWKYDQNKKTAYIFVPPNVKHYIKQLKKQNNRDIETYASFIKNELGVDEIYINDHDNSDRNHNELNVTTYISNIPAQSQPYDYQYNHDPHTWHTIGNAIKHIEQKAQYEQQACSNTLHHCRKKTGREDVRITRDQMLPPVSAWRKQTLIDYYYNENYIEDLSSSFHAELFQNPSSITTSEYFNFPQPQEPNKDPLPRLESSDVQEIDYFTYFTHDELPIFAHDDNNTCEYRPQLIPRSDYIGPRSTRIFNLDKNARSKLNLEKDENGDGFHITQLICPANIDPHDINLHNANMYIVLNGTFAQGDEAYHDPMAGDTIAPTIDHAIHQAYKQKRPCIVASYDWNGHNNMPARETAATKLRHFLANIAHKFYYCDIIPHSHGRQVSVIALLKLAKMYNISLTSLAGPIRRELRSDKLNTGETFQFYSTNDLVQLGGSASVHAHYETPDYIIRPKDTTGVIKNWIKWLQTWGVGLERKDECHNELGPTVYNVHVYIDGEAPGHSDIRRIMPRIFDIKHELRKNYRRSKNNAVNLYYYTQTETFDIQPQQQEQVY